jgi:hypothetical protein
MVRKAFTWFSGVLKEGRSSQALAEQKRLHEERLQMIDPDLREFYDFSPVEKPRIHPTEAVSGNGIL